MVVDIVNVPWQHLRPTIQQKGIRARNAAAAEHRSLLKGAKELDGNSYDRAISTKNTDDARWLRTVANL